ncbi:MAG: YMGG-like glycine zipper-containing protein [Planctomycetota bacterium]
MLLQKRTAFLLIRSFYAGRKVLARRSFVCLMMASCLSIFTCQSVLSQSRTKDGATVGGLAGAVIGGIIGKQNDETPEGALIGGAVGAITGGLIGKSQDNELARQRYYQQQAYYAQQQQYYAQQQATQQAVQQSGVSMNDVLNMSRSGLSESLILTQLQSRGVQNRLAVSDIISLHQQGVSDTIITAMQSAPLSTQVRNASQTTARPVSTYSQVPSYNPIPTYQPSVVIQPQPVIYSRPPVYVERVYRSCPPVQRHYHYGPYRNSASIRIGF